MPIDSITIICSAILICMAIISSLLNPFFRFNVRKSLKNNENEDNKKQPISIIFTAYNETKNIEERVSALLAQDYEPGLEVVVVIEKSNSDLEDRLKQISSNNRLYITFIPQNSRYMSRKKLAITLGVKAAKNEWIVLIDSCCYTTSTKWLDEISKEMVGNNIVMNYCNYECGTKDYYIFEQLRSSLYTISKAMNDFAHKSLGNSIAFRKSEFINQEGYKGNLQYIGGEFDFIANKYACKKSTGIALNSNAIIREDIPFHNVWRIKHLYYLNIRKHLNHSNCIRLLFNFDMFMMYINYISIFSLLVYSIIIKNWTIMAATLVSLAITISLRILFANRAIKTFKEDISLWKIIPYELGVMWSNLGLILYYMVSNKIDFTSHKL